ncbi:uncharacterized protein LOC111385868 [Olea europaea var. sylvestris]|uniref:uncharacterized protein LOC111385868 n=1 Tax=Olea europaea var. sylvestris TaxID=158386 RepID=UPI000C1CEB27|nr:uncharacterized protein LOC111385868 [Olea europaea var. sylvestris]
MISFLHMGGLFRVEHWRGDVTLASFFGISLTCPLPPPPIMVVWRTPPVGSFKINTDGCVKDGFASAELRAILDGLLLARGLGISAIWLEADSTLAIHCITKGGGPWSIQGILRQIRDFICLDRDTVSHIYREGNQVADSLASEGWDHQRYQEYGPLDLPRQIRALVQIDRYGLPSFRGL